MIGTLTLTPPHSGDSAGDPAFASVASPAAGRSFLLSHLLLPALLSLPLGWLLTAGSGDALLAQWLFRWEGSAWTLKHAWLTETLLHDAGRTASTLAWLAVVGALVWAWRQPIRQHWRRPLLYLLLTVVSSVALVSGLKRSVLSDCPWDQQGLGGTRPALAWFEPRPSQWPTAHCFPAGHASAGFAWLGLYFLPGTRRQRRLRLALVLAVGTSFGVAQQLRGAHFASHDLVSAWLCWFAALAWLPLLRPLRGARP